MEEAKGEGSEATLGVNATDMRRTGSGSFFGRRHMLRITLAATG